MESQICTHCNANKPLVDFSWKNKSKGKRTVCCKICYRKKRNKFYSKNKAAELKTILAYRYKRKAELQKWFWDYKSKLCCVECGKAKTPTLQFHHLDREDKDQTLSQAINNVWPMKRILKEIAKCKVLCANCHAMEHYKERIGNSYSGNTAVSKTENQSSIL